MLALARKGLRLDLRAALRDAMETGKQVIRDNVAVEMHAERIQVVTIIIDPMREQTNERALFLVLFVDSGPALNPADIYTKAYSGTEEAIGHLEQDLRETRERLQSVIEEYETALEELKSSNEELVLVNEELQSTNEELEASKEELQSLNEELHTVNAELGFKVDALDEANSDLRNLFESTQIATIFLDRGLLIRNFTPAASALFDIVPSDRGRSLTSFSTRLAYPELQDDIRATLVTHRTTQRSVSREDGSCHFLVRVRPYEGTGSRVEGIIMTFVDVTALKTSEHDNATLVIESRDLAKAALATTLLALDEESKRATTVEAFSRALSARLAAIARDYD